MARVNDPIGDMLTRIRNASNAKHERTTVPASKLKEAVIKVLKEEGYIKDFVLHKNETQGEITVFLKYGDAQAPVIREIKRISKPGLRRYVPADAIPRVLGGLGISILSTSKGVLADKDCRKQSLGGELICTVY
jgi:small subunit ribosomal protein S8